MRDNDRKIGCTKTARCLFFCPLSFCRLLLRGHLWQCTSAADHWLALRASTPRSVLPAPGPLVQKPPGSGYSWVRPGFVLGSFWVNPGWLVGRSWVRKWPKTRRKLDVQTQRKSLRPKCQDMHQWIRSERPEVGDRRSEIGRLGGPEGRPSPPSASPFLPCSLPCHTLDRPSALIAPALRLGGGATA